MPSPLDILQGQPLKHNSTADTNPRLVNAGKTALSVIVCSNVGGAAAFVKLYDKASAPVPGTDIPVLTIPVPAAGLQEVDVSDTGLIFNLGLGIGITNLGPDADATAVAAGQLKILGTYFY